MLLYAIGIENPSGEKAPYTLIDDVKEKGQSKGGVAYKPMNGWRLFRNAPVSYSAL